MSGEYISKAKATSFPFANDQYDHVHADPHFIAGCETYKEWLNSIPAAEVVEAVRCRDCKYTEKWHDHIYCQRLRDRWNHCNDRMVDDADFCAWGKRKDGGPDA